MIFGIDFQHLAISFDGSIDLAGLFMRKRPVIGFRQCFFVDLRHNHILVVASRFTCRGSVWQLRGS
ncbi:hypothetical protein D3C87_2010640 [compost metagenome]